MKRVGWILAITTLGAVLGEALFVEKRHHPIGFHAAIGLVSCVAVVLLSKAAGKLFLQRPEDRDE